MLADALHVLDCLDQKWNDLANENHSSDDEDDVDNNHDDAHDDVDDEDDDNMEDDDDEDVQPNAGMSYEGDDWEPCLMPLSNSGNSIILSNV